jgi:hypothetical protein
MAPAADGISFHDTQVLCTNARGSGCSSRTTCWPSPSSVLFSGKRPNPSESLRVALLRLLLHPHHAQLPPLSLLRTFFSSSILATRFLNSSYWHFSYECRSSWKQSVQQIDPVASHGCSSYLTLPRQVVRLEPASIQWYQEMCTAVAVCER